MTCDRQSDVREAELDKLPHTVEPAMPFGREDGEGREQSCHGVPCRQHVIHGTLMTLRPCQPWEPKRGVDRVVDRGPAIGVAGDDDHDCIGPQLRELFVRAPALDGQVGQQDPSTFPGRRYEAGHLAASKLGAGVDGHRALALVQAGPVKAAAAMQRPTVDVQSAARWVDANHVRTQRRQRRAAEGRGDER